MLKLLASAALLAGLAYVAIAAALFFAQTNIFFPARVVPRAGPLPPGAERIEFTAPDGVRLEGVLIPPVLAGPANRTAILGFAGNASNAAAIAEFLGSIYPEHPVVAFHYRGYRPSGGSPSAAALLDDAPLLYDLARQRLRPERIVAVGISIGSGVAAGLPNAAPSTDWSWSRLSTPWSRRRRALPLVARPSAPPAQPAFSRDPCPRARAGCSRGCRA
jgi:hypothetical protein